MCPEKQGYRVPSPILLPKVYHKSLLGVAVSARTLQLGEKEGRKEEQSRKIVSLGTHGLHNFVQPWA